MINIPKGTKDVLPEESYKWHYVENAIRELTKAYNIKEIRTPTFEHTELFLRGVGETTDIVNKEMYTFLDKGDRSITLKPEGTAGVGRAYIENGLASEAMPIKMYYLTPVFRYEKPQTGRLREHHQFGIEFYGASQPSMDAEIISVAHTFFEKLGIKNITLYINSIGCPTCRKAFNEALKEYYKPQLEKMCPTCNERFNKNPLRMLDCKVEECKNINKNAPVILDYLCDDCKEHFESLKQYLDVAGIEYKVNPNIVRGLDYYTRTVFEFVSENIGSQGTVCGGGRYDGLVEQLGGKSTPCMGFGLGLERLILLMENVGIEIPKESGCDLYFAPFGKSGSLLAFDLCTRLRKLGISAETDQMSRSFKAQFKYANKIGAKNVIAIGDNEVANGTFKIKNMSTSTEKEVAIEEFVKALSSKEDIVKILGL